MVIQNCNKLRTYCMRREEGLCGAVTPLLKQLLQLRHFCSSYLQVRHLCSNYLGCFLENTMQTPLPF